MVAFQIPELKNIKYDLTIIYLFILSEFLNIKNQNKSLIEMIVYESQQFLVSSFPVDHSLSCNDFYNLSLIHIK
jgi:hypothetical protein